VRTKHIFSHTLKKFRFISVLDVSGATFKPSQRLHRLFLPDHTSSSQIQTASADEQQYYPLSNEIITHHGGSNAYNFHFGSPVMLKIRTSSDSNPISELLLPQALFLCALFLSKKENVHLFSTSLPRFDKCHQMS